MAKAKRWMLAEVGFFGSLLAVGSIITQEDLGYGTDEKGKKVAIKPPKSAIEVDELGRPVSDEDAAKYAEIFGGNVGVEIAAVAPFAPNPTAPQAAPAQAPGGLQLAEGALQLAPAPGVESDEARAAREEQAENREDAVAAAAKAAGGKPAPAAAPRVSRADAAKAGDDDKKGDDAKADDGDDGKGEDKK